MKTARIIGIVAASTLAAAALTGAAVATAATVTAKNSTQQSQGDHKADQKGERRGPGDGDHGPGMGPGPGMGDHGPGMGPGDHGPRGELLHGQMVIEEPDGTIVTEQMQEGEVTAVSATSISLKSTDGFTATYVINADTELERDHADGTAAQVGDIAHVRGTVDGSTVTAEDVDALSPAAAKAMEQQRKAWQSGNGTTQG